MADLSTYIARRYLVSKRKARFINVIGVISIAGITVGVAALLVALSVFNGFNGVVTNVLVSFDPHVRIEKKGGMSTAELQSIEHLLPAVKEVKAYSPFVAGKAMLVAGSLNRVVFLRGVDEKRIGEVTGLEKKIVLGELHFQGSADAAGIVIGMNLADRLASVVGDRAAVITPYGFQSTLSGLSAPETMPVEVTGIFESHNKDYDGTYAFVSLQVAQQLFEMEGRFTGIDLRLHDFGAAEDVKSTLTGMLPGEYSVSTWYDLHRTLYLVMNIERWSAYILLSLIIAVATFNMLGSLTMAVMEKRRDIAVLKALGMNSRGIIRLFMVEGLLIGVIGTMLGILLGLFVLYLQVQYQLFPLDPSVYIIPAIPVEIRWSDFVSITLASMSLAFLAAYYPAKRAAATLPAEALRWE